MAEGALQLTEQQTQAKSVVAFGARGLSPSDLDGAWRCAQLVARSGLAPKGVQTPEAILVAATMGAELGLTFMQSLQNIAVVNGRPAIWGDALLALCQGTGEMVEFSEILEGDGDGMAAVCRVARERNGSTRMQTEERFSVSDAKAAGLWKKAGPWTQYPRRMLKMRARGFALRDMFADVLKGVRPAEEVLDMPAVADAGPGTPFAVEEVPQPQPAPAAPVEAQAATDTGEMPRPPAPPEKQVRRRVHGPFAVPEDLQQQLGGPNIQTAGIQPGTLWQLLRATGKDAALVMDSVDDIEPPLSQPDPTFLRETEGQAIVAALEEAHAAEEAQPETLAPGELPMDDAEPTPPGMVLCRGVNAGDTMKLGYCEHQCSEFQSCAEYAAARKQATKLF
jgi:hypothetical protein